MENKNETTCCPQFNPEPWQDKTVVWDNKLFIKENIPQIFHIPLPGTIGKMMARMWKKIETAKAAPPTEEFLWVSYDPSPWKSENYIHVTKEVPNAENVRLSGKFITKVFDGPFQDVPKWINEMSAFLATKKLTAIKYYFYFTTCPNCAKKYRHNYVVIFAQI